MRRFFYKARDMAGKQTSGKVEADSAVSAARLLRERGLVVVSVTGERLSLKDIFEKIFARVSLGDIALFTRQFATMITSGLPITESLLIIRGQSKPALKPVVERMLSDIEGGSSLADAIRRHPKVFSPVYVALIQAGESGGVLDKILLQLADNLEAQREFRAKVKGALIYPSIVVIGMIVVSGVMMVFVVPKMTALFEDFDAELPLSTKVLIGSSELFSKFWWILVGVFFLLGVGLRYWAKTPSGRERIDRMRLKLPVLGPLHKQVILAELTRTLGLLVGAGVSILEALRIASGVVGNYIVSSAIGRSSSQVEKGFALSQTLAKEPDVFPPMLYQMIAVGEETGKLDESLLKVARIFEQESEQSVKGLTAAVEPLVMIVLGIGVGFLVIAIIMPIYNLTGQF